jgi:periplasmic protein TonB
MNTITSTADLNDLIFLNKNREYGAYFLRKNYNKYLTMAVLITAVFFLLGISSPIIINYLNPKKPIATDPYVSKHPTVLGDVPSIIENKKPVERIEEIKQLRTTLAFRPPVIQPDYKVKDDYVPSQIDLQTVEPGRVSVIGDPNAADPILIETEIPQIIPIEKQAKAEVFTHVEEMPAFPGGSDAFLTFVAQNIRYPEIAKRAGVEGRVAISFVVSPSGNVSDVQVAKSIGAGCDEEAVRVIKSMPKWNPGKQNGRPVNVQVSVPIVFRLQ